MKATFLAGLLLAGVAVAASAQTITSLNDPSAGTAAGQGPVAVVINATGVITGAYIDRNTIGHGFIRTAAGKYTNFSAPGGVQLTAGVGINSGNVITGFSLDANSAFHGFVRTKAGVITNFDAPGAGTLAGQGTEPYSINTAGTITGFYNDSTGVYHGFMRSATGTITSFDAPGAGNGNHQGTLADGINKTGMIAGGYLTHKIIIMDLCAPPPATSPISTIQRRHQPRPRRLTMPAPSPDSTKTAMV